MTISTSVTSFTRPRNSLTKTTASWTVLYIFQLPAMNGVLIFYFAWGPTPTRPQDLRCRSASSVDSRPRAEGADLVGRAGQVRNLPAQPDPPASPALHLSVNAATPGSVRPPRNSSDAPPPVEMCVIRSAIPAFFTAAIESPPPTIVVPLTA